AIALAGFGHFLDLLPGFLLRIVLGAVLQARPFFDEAFHLKMVEDRLAKGIDAAKQREVPFIAGGNHVVKHYPIAALSQIIFQFYDERHAESVAREAQERKYRESLKLSDHSLREKRIHFGPARSRFLPSVGMTKPCKGYFPMQKRLKIRLRMSSFVVAPVISSRERKALYKSSRSISWGILFPTAVSAAVRAEIDSVTSF